MALGTSTAAPDSTAKTPQGPIERPRNVTISSSPLSCSWVGAPTPTEERNIHPVIA